VPLGQQGGEPGDGGRATAPVQQEEGAALLAVALDGEVDGALVEGDGVRGAGHAVLLGRLVEPWKKR
jgi:hypothetical protein